VVASSSGRRRVRHASEHPADPCLAEMYTHAVANGEYVVRPMEVVNYDDRPSARSPASSRYSTITPNPNPNPSSAARPARRRTSGPSRTRNLARATARERLASQGLHGTLTLRQARQAELAYKRKHG
jgi:hypothetical protein